MKTERIGGSADRSVGEASASVPRPVDSPIPSVLVIGGGFAGLSAATALAEQGFKVHVVEGRQHLGGRAYSFYHPTTHDSVDNGQHLFMGCYYETQAFLKRIGTTSQLEFQSNLKVPFASSGGQRSALSCWPLPAPFHLLSGLLRLKTLSWGDRFRLIRLDRALRRAVAHPQEIANLTVRQWLTHCGQSDRAQRHLWDLIAIAALNEDPTIASASAFVTVLAQAFFDTRAASRLGLSTVGLSDLYVGATRQFLLKRNADITLRSPIARLHIHEGRVASVELRDGKHLNPTWVVSAVPPDALLNMLPETVRRSAYFSDTAKLRFAPIISIHLWFDRVIENSDFVGMLDTHVQWFFNKARIYRGIQTHVGYVSLVLSGAHQFMDWDEKRLLTMALEELRRVMPAAKEAVLEQRLVIKEHHATLSPFVGSEDLRPLAQTPIPNLILAGDWTRTGLPATIESACISGHKAAHIIASFHSTSRSSSPANADKGPSVRLDDDGIKVSATNEEKKVAGLR